jgi:transcriptional/translational regulatory protein YebC/TACO1
VLGGAGTAAWAFDRKGVVVIPKGSATEDQLMEVAVGAGAEDYGDMGDEWHVTTPSDAMNVVVDALDKAHIASKSSSLAFLPKTKKPLAGREAEVALNLADALDDHDDVQNVFADFDVSDEDLARIEGAK